MEDGGQLIGAAGPEAYAGNGLLRSVVVRADRRGIGVGRALHGVYLLTQTAPECFRRLGFFG